MCTRVRHSVDDDSKAVYSEIKGGVYELTAAAS